MATQNSPQAQIAPLEQAVLSQGFAQYSEQVGVKRQEGGVKGEMQ